VKFNLVGTEDNQNITVFHDGEMYVASSEHANFQAIVAGAIADDPNVVDLFDTGKTIQSKFEQLTERVSVRNGKVYFDADELNNAVTNHIVRIISQGDGDVEPVALFLEKLMQNENAHSRENLYRWLQTADFTLSPSGDIIAYKGVKAVNADNKVEYFSISRGKAIVNGEEKEGAIPNALGNVVEMPRSKVQFDPGVGCSTGLHAGTWEYAKDFSQGAVLEVHINPRDVVSVPTDCNDQKLRCCRYIVVDIVEVPYTAPVYDGRNDWVSDDDLDDEEYDDFYDEDSAYV